uniref:Uncharacterized protein n=1 Tax=Physcomitrium patens TaxID=3218 RepID=A0A2K1L0F7_PHYPA|nr:hypothetical protein PHYPA_002300 [Physcomitrium patens]
MLRTIFASSQILRNFFTFPLASFFLSSTAFRTTNFLPSRSRLTLLNRFSASSFVTNMFFSFFTLTVKCRMWFKVRLTLNSPTPVHLSALATMAFALGPSSFTLMTRSLELLFNMSTFTRADFVAGTLGRTTPGLGAGAGAGETPASMVAAAARRSTAKMKRALAMVADKRRETNVVGREQGVGGIRRQGTDDQLLIREDCSSSTTKDGVM